MIEETRVLQLCLVISSNDDRNKEFQEYKSHNKHVADKECECTALTTASNRFISISNVIIICWIIYAIIESFETMSEWLSSVIPRIPSGNREQSNESTGETLKIDIIIHGLVPFNLAKINHSNYRIYVHK
jgi:hypothetical protein